MTIKILFTLSICIFFIPTFIFTASACVESDIQETDKLMAAGMYDKAISILEKCINYELSGPEVYYGLGTCYLNINKFEKADRHFIAAEKLDIKYAKTVGETYKEAGIKSLTTGKVKEAAILFDKAIGYDSALRESIAESSFQRGVKTLNKVYFDLAISLKSNYQKKIFSFIIDKANESSDKKCVNLYKLAAYYCDKTCDRIKQAGSRLVRLANSIEKKNAFDARIDKYKNIARNFVDLEPDYKIYDTGVHPFKLSKGDLTSWIRSKGDGEKDYEFRSNNQKYEILLRNGKVYRAWAGDALPRLIDYDIKIKAADETIIFLTIR